MDFAFLKTVYLFCLLLDFDSVLLCFFQLLLSDLLVYSAVLLQLLHEHSFFFHRKLLFFLFFYKLLKLVKFFFFLQVERLLFEELLDFLVLHLSKKFSFCFFFNSFR